MSERKNTLDVNDNRFDTTGEKCRETTVTRGIIHM